MSKGSNRVQRKIDAKPTTPPDGQKHDQEFLQKVQAMLRREIDAPNEYVAYQLGQLREAQAEFQALQSNVQQGEQQLQNMRNELQRSDGRIDARLSDIRIWLEPQEADEMVTQSPDDAVAVN